MQTATAVATNTGGIIGGAVGGTVLLITLCIIMWYVLKKRKSSYSTGKTHFMSSVSFLNSKYASCFSSHDFELTNMKGNITGIDLGMRTTTCK